MIIRVDKACSSFLTIGLEQGSFWIVAKSWSQDKDLAAPTLLIDIFPSGKQFTNIGNLATHARTHTKEKPYKCDKCDLMFAHTSNLQRHQLVHTGQRNNKCPHCSKCFSRSDYLKVHERTHTGKLLSKLHLSYPDIMDNIDYISSLYSVVEDLYYYHHQNTSN